MHIINISVREKVATNTGATFYVCGNSDFVVHFDFDAEWADLDTKTARFISENGTYKDKIFTGNDCPVPIISNTDYIRVGVYAGNLQTTTPARVQAARSILCGAGAPADPAPDVYNQIMQMIEDGKLRGERGEKGDPGDDFSTLAIDEYGNAILTGGEEIEIPPIEYVLPTASKTVKGGVMVGDGLQMSGDVLSVDLSNHYTKDEVDTAIDNATKGDASYVNKSVTVVDSGLTYSRGVLEVRKVGDVLWIQDSGVYNFTDSFKAAKNRTVLQFTLPKEISNKIPNTNGAYGTVGTVMYFPALAYENVTYSTFNCQSYLKRSAIGDTEDTYQVVYTGLSAISGGGLCGFHLRMPVLLVAQS